MGQNSRIIDSVIMIRHQVFEDTLQKPAFFYKGANKFHKLTRKKVIENQLLFKKGDSLDLELLYETEVRLRKYDFLREVKTSVDTISNEISATVETKDSWSLVPTFDIESSKGYDSYSIGLVEYNFLGLGKTIAGGYTWESDVGYTIGVGYEDPQLFNSRWKAELYTEFGPNSNLFSSSVYRPLYSSDVKWSYGLDIDLGEEVERLFHNGEEVSRMLKDFTKFNVFTSRRFGDRYDFWKVSLKYKYSDKDYSEIDNLSTIPIPEDELINALQLGLKRKKIHFSKDIRLKQFVVTEDLFLGTTYSGFLTKTAFPFDFGIDRFEYGLSFEWVLMPFKRSYLGINLDYYSKGDVDEIYSFFIDFYSRITDNQTLAFYTQISFSDNLQPYKQFLLGGDDGLRGYPARYVTGDYLLASTIEDRIFTGIQMFGIELGGVVFADAGYVWKKDQNASINDILISVGCGLRFGFYAYPGAEVFRIDYAIPLNGLPPQFSIGFGQSF